ncbi:MAG: class flavin-dependent oxidoreductase [Nocardia sp.]|nr:hypothetical protein [Nocardia sp.]MCU1641360.1 class flavin-dependent oxidoreductase [Nocardia sp.]
MKFLLLTLITHTSALIGSPAEVAPLLRHHIPSRPLGADRYPSGDPQC